MYVVHIPGPYTNALWAGVAFTLMSLLAGVAFFYLEWKCVVL